MPHIDFEAGRKKLEDVRQKSSAVLNSSKAVKIGGRQVAYREIVIIALAIAFVLIAGGCCVALIASHGTSTTVVVNVTEVCTSHACLYSSAKLAGLADLTGDPCDDFYLYACGKYFTINVSCTACCCYPVVGWLKVTVS